VFQGLLQMPYSPDATRVEFHRTLDRNECRLVALAHEKIVGGLGLHVAGFSLRRSHVRGLGLFVAKEWQGRGVGRRLLEAALDWADNWAHVLRIELHVHADNERARKLYESMGFVEEGRHRGYALKDGRSVASFSMARLHPNPPRIA
jgi:putative acetyltransferase